MQFIAMQHKKYRVAIECNLMQRIFTLHKFYRQLISFFISVTQDPISQSTCLSLWMLSALLSLYAR